MSSSEIQQLEHSIKVAQKLVDLGDSLERLRNNRDFKKIFVEGYFQDEAVRLVHLRADANMQSVDSRKAIDTQIDAIGTVGQYLQPHARRLPVERYWTPAEFDEVRRAGEAMGFARVESAPLVRSSYHARHAL